jgi:uncharacterized protein YeaO (DUF488 family)
MAIHVKRVYQEAEKEDGLRILVDRIWPRGVSKERAALDLWLKEIGPSPDLRQSFHAGDMDFGQFSKRYERELTSGKQKEAYHKLIEIAAGEPVITLVFAAKDEVHNQAQVLKDMLEKEKDVIAEG